MARGPVAEGLGRAEAFSDAGEYAAALDELEAAMLAEPTNAAVHTARGWAPENLGPERLMDAGVDRLRGVVRVAMDDLEESLAERPALGGTREAIAARDLLRSTLRAASQ